MPKFDEYHSHSNHLNSELDEVIQEAEIQQVDEVLEDSMEESEEMSDVERRLEEANCYKALLKNPLFQDASPIAQRVENTIRDFIRSQLRILIGLESSKPTAKTEYQSNFTKEEEVALKEIAGRLIEKHRSTQIPKVEPAKLDENVRTPVVNVNSTVKVPKVVKKAKKEEPVEMRDVEFPDGVVRKVPINRREQTKSNKPSYTLQQIADMSATQAQEQALQSTPVSGILGIAVHAANNGLIKNNKEDE